MAQRGEGAIVRYVFIFILLSAACQHGPSDTALFSYDGKEVARDDLPETTKQELFKIDNSHYEEVRTQVQDALLEMHYAELAKQKKTTPLAIKDKLLGSGYQPSEAEMQAFYNKNKASLPYTYEQIKNELQDWMKDELKKQKRQALLVQIEKEKNVRFHLPKPIAPKLKIDTDAFPKISGKTKKIQLVEFGDFLCPYCQKAHGEIKQLLKTRGDEIEFVFMFFPSHLDSLNENFARAGYCALMQNKFWQFHDYIFENQFKVMIDSMNNTAKAVGLKEDALNACLQDKATHAFVRKSYEQGKRLGVSKTPAFFLGGRQISVEPIKDNFVSLIDDELRQY